MNLEDEGYLKKRGFSAYKKGVASLQAVHFLYLGCMPTHHLSVSRRPILSDIYHIKFNSVN